MKGFRYIYIYIYIYIYNIFQILFVCRLLQNSKYSSLCYTVIGPCFFYIYYCVYVTPKFLIYLSSAPFPFGNHKFVFYVCDSISVL